VDDLSVFVDVDLDEEERHLLRCGIGEWLGPARCTDEMAVAIGFESVADLIAQADGLIEAVLSGGATSRRDWRRILLATEIVFASDVVGSGVDWTSTTGLSDAESIAVLRRVQRKVIGAR